VRNHALGGVTVASKLGRTHLTENAGSPAPIPCDTGMTSRPIVSYLRVSTHSPPVAPKAPATSGEHQATTTERPLRRVLRATRECLR
jgi:hypothetical protein